MSATITTITCGWCGEPGRNRCHCKCKPEDHHRVYGTRNICDRCCTHIYCERCKGCPCKCIRCRSCGDIVVRKCGCCGNARIDTCENCCRHSCCRVPVQMINEELVFVVPTARAAKSEFPYDFLDESLAENVLFKNVGPGKLNLRRFQLNNSRRFASAEIEVAGVRNGAVVNEVCHDWRASIVHDGSLPMGGFEINTAPACGDAMYDQIEQICNVLSRENALVNQHCGFHVHVDVRDYGYHDIQRFIRVYHKTESALFAACHPSRAANRYCRPCGAQYYKTLVNGVKGNTSILKRAVVNSAYADGADALLKVVMDNGKAVGVPRLYNDRTHHRGGEHNPNRYNAINLHTFFMRGTVENRMHHGTINPAIILGWMQLHVDLFDRVFSASFKEIVEITERRWKQREMSRILSNFPAAWKHTTIASLDGVISGLLVLNEILPPQSWNFLLGKIIAQGLGGTFNA